MRVLLTGASGQLGSYLAEAVVAAGHELVAWSGRTQGGRAGVELVPVDLADRKATLDALERADPELVLHAAAVSAVDAVWRDPDQAQRVNIEATRVLAGWCRRQNRRLLFTSTDLVFDGKRSWYREDDPAEPVLTYGRTKRAAEDDVLAVPRGLVTRISLLFGPSRCGRPSFFDRTLAAIGRGEPERLFTDEFRTPIHYATAAAILVRLAQGEQTGLLHVAGTERMSRYDLMRQSAASLGLDPALVVPGKRADAALPEPRPADVSLDTSRLAGVLPGVSRPTIEQAMAVYPLPA